MDTARTVQALTHRLEQLEAAAAKRRPRRTPRPAARAAASVNSYATHAAPFVVRHMDDGMPRYVVRINDRLLKVAVTPESTQHRALAGAVAERDALVSAARCAIVLRGRYPKLVAR